MIAVFAAAALLVQQPVIAGPDGQRLDSIVRAAHAAGFHGNVLVARRGEVLLLQGYGLANRAANTPFTPSTLVQIGSNVKDFTKLAIWQLIEQGRLRLTDSLPMFFDRIPADKAGITVRQLLHHRSGLPHVVAASDDEGMTKEEMLRRVRAATLEAAPGTREIYSNVGYSLLAAIVERLSGQSFDAYVARHILQPAGVRETGVTLPRFDRSRVARGYAGGRDMGIILDKPSDADGHQWQLRGNGGYLSTLSEMHRFYQALRGPTLLREQASRDAVMNFSGPNIAAGSDRVSFFMFASFPGAGVEVFIASNHQEYMGNRLLQQLTPALGIRRDGPDGPGGPGAEIVTDNGPRRDVTAPMLPRVPDTPVGRVVQAYLAAYATGDTAAMRRFFTEHAAGPGAPPMATRLERYLQMRGNLGNLTVRGAQATPEGFIVAATSSNGEEVQLTFVLDTQPPHTLRGIRVEN